MTILLILMGLTGAVLGTRFTVLILIPGLAICTAIVTGACVLRGTGLSYTLGFVIGAGAALQLGYILGAVLRVATVQAQIVRSAAFSAQRGSPERIAR